MYHWQHFGWRGLERIAVKTHVCRSCGILIMECHNSHKHSQSFLNKCIVKYLDIAIMHAQVEPTVLATWPLIVVHLQIPFDAGPSFRQSCCMYHYKMD